MPACSFSYTLTHDNNKLVSLSAYFHHNTRQERTHEHPDITAKETSGLNQYAAYKRLTGTNTWVS